MNICMFTKYFDNDTKRGGVETHVEDVVNSLANAGHHVFVITGKSDLNEISTHKNITILRTDERITASPFTRLRFFRKSRQLFAELLAGTKINIIHSQSNFAYGCLGIARRKHIPIFTTAHGTTINELKTIASTRRLFSLLISPLFLIYYLIEYRLYHSSHKVFAVSEELLTDIHRQLFVASPQLGLLLNGVDQDIFKPATKFVASPPKLLMIGTVIRQKGVALAIEAMPAVYKAFPGLRLTIAGTGADMEYCEQRAAELHLQTAVTFLGQIPRQKVPQLCQSANLFLFPSLGKEGLPYAVLEAMACGLPVIATRTGGVQSLITDQKNGVLVSIDLTAKELSTAIIKLLSDSQKMQLLGKNARKEIVTKYSKTAMLDKILYWYKAAGVKE